MGENKKPKLLIYSDCYIYGGSERLMAFLIQNTIVQESYQITFAYRMHKIYQKGLNTEFDSRGKADFMPVIVLSNETLFYKIDSIKYHRVLKKITKGPFFLLNKIGIYFVFNLISHIITLLKVAPDIIHINNGGYPGAKSCNIMVLAAKIFGFKSVVYQVNNMAQSQTDFFDKLYDSFVNQHVESFITASSQAKEKLIIERHFDAHKVQQIPNTVQDENVTLYRNEILNELGININDFIICTVAFLSKRKGQQFLLEALCIIRQNLPDLFNKMRLILVGNGEDELLLKDFVRINKIDRQIYFLGYQSKSINYINACDVFVLPSIANEDMPLVVLSAMSKGKTIVSTDLAGIREEIENGINGILVSPNPDTIASDLAKVIVELFHNRNTSLGSEAQKRFHEIFSEEVYGNSIIKLYNKVIEKSKEK